MIMMKVIYKTSIDREIFIKRMYDDGHIDAIRKEPGNISYEYYLPKERDDEIMLIEMWTDLAAQETHQANDRVKEIGRLKEEYGIISTYTKYNIEEM